MDIKTILKKYLVFVIGLYFLAAGIVLIIHSTLGTTPISSVNYVLSLNSPLSLGTCTFIVNVFLILGQFWLSEEQKAVKTRYPSCCKFHFRSYFQHSSISIWHSLKTCIHPTI